MNRRDSQRSKLYRAERAARIVGHQTDPRFETVDLIETYLDGLVERAWFKRRWGSDVTKRPEVRPGYGARSAFGGMHAVTFPKWARHEGVVLHEMAHHIMFRTYGYHSDVAAHGWEFCAIYLQLVRYAMGKEAHDALRQSMRDNRVRYTKPRNGRPLSEAEKQVLRDRLAKARATKNAATLAAKERQP